MPIKIIQGDNQDNTRRFVAASGSYNREKLETGKKNYGSSNHINLPITKSAQFAGAGANVVFTQPMFFSPLHTPINWQIASKRREIYQWSFISPCLITLYDGSLREISEIYEEATPMSSYISLISDDYIGVQDGYGNICVPDKTSKRWQSKKANKITVSGVAEPLTVTHDHKCMVIRKEDVSCTKSKWNKKKCITNNSSPTCKKYKCKDYLNKDYEIKEVKAEDVRKGDYFLVPFNTEIKPSIITTIEEARYAGHLASDGTVSTKSRSVRICMNDDDIAYVYPVIKNVHTKHNASTTLCNVSTIQEVRSAKPSLFKFGNSLVRGKGSNKKFTKEVMFLDPNLQKHVIGAYIQSDGTFNKQNNCIDITTYSPHLGNQLVSMCFRSGILARINKQPISRSKKTFKTNNEYRYIISIPSKECSKIAEYSPGKVKHTKNVKTNINRRFFWKNFVVAPIQSNESFDYEGYVYDVRVPSTHTVTSNGVSAYQCLFENTQILMANGTTKDIDKVNIGDYVISHTGESRKVVDIGRRYVNEDIYTVKSSGLTEGITLTGNHKIRCLQKNAVVSNSYASSYQSIANVTNEEISGSSDWVKTEQVNVGDYLFSPNIKIDCEIPSWGIDINEDLLFLLGLYAAEGCIAWYRYKGVKRYPKGIRLTISKKETKLLDRLSQIVKNQLGSNINFYKNGSKTSTSNDSWDVHIYNKSFANICHDHVGCGARKKKLSKDIISLPDDLLCSFLSGLFTGDGHMNDKWGFLELVSASQQMAQQVCFCAMRLEIPFKLYSQISKVNTTHYHILYQLIPYSKNNITKYGNVRRNSKVAIFKSISNSVEGQSRKIRSISITPYSGFVYNIEVDEDNSYVANNVIVKNSRFYYENEPKVAAGVDFYCFEPNAQVLMANGKQRSISSVSEGDLVRSHDGSVGVVNKVHCKITEEDMFYINIAGVNNGALKVTGGHRILVERKDKIKWMQVWELEKGDNLLTPCNCYNKDKKDNYIHRKIISIRKKSYTGKVYDLTINGSHTYVVNEVAVHNSTFPMNNFKLECKDKKILKFYEKVVKELKLNHWLKAISHEYFLLGDVYPFLEIVCPQCSGTGVLGDSVCNHPGGTIQRILVLNPDWIEVQKNVLASEPVISLVPDEELRMIVQRKQPRQIYDRLPQRLVEMVASGRPIPLSNRCVSHIAHNASPYGAYGSSMLRRLFTPLAYKTKLMTANWIVAERLIIPVRVIKVGDKDRPATADDIQDVSNQFAAVANDPNVTIVTHHALDYEYYGACYSDDTEILTENGWKHFYSLDKEEKVATYNTNSGYMEYQLPLKHHVYDFESNPFLKMYNFKAKSVDTCVTPNHRMLVTRSGELLEVRADKVKHDDKFLSTVDWEGYIPEELPYSDSDLSHMELDEFLEFSGYYLSEGSIQVERYKNLSPQNQIRSCYIYQSTSSPHYGDMKSSVAIASKDEKEYINPLGMSSMRIYNCKIAQYLAKTFGINSYVKKIPKWMKQLPKSKLNILLKALLDGDGNTRTDTLQTRYKYITASKQLADDVSDICLKLGYFTTTSIEQKESGRCTYRVYWSERRKEILFNIRKQHIKKLDYSGKVYCVEVPNTWLITRRNGRITIQGNTGKIHNITGEIEQIGKELLDGMMLNQSLLNGDMASYSSAQVGVETMIRRLESWRSQLAEWVQDHIFLPIAMMQGFIDEEESKEMKEVVYLYPELKWNDLNLRDKSNHYQFLMQLHDKKLISSQKLLEEFDINYDQEIVRLREEAVLIGPGGQMGGMPGGMGGGMPMGGAMGGMPPGGGEVPLGAPEGGMIGEAGMPGTEMAGGAPGAPGATPMTAASPDLKITKRGKQGAKPEQEQYQPQFLKLTSLEKILYKILQKLEVPYGLYGQYEVLIPGEQSPFVLDFAYPAIGVCLESDGDIWHNRLDTKARDRQRDQKLANVGWRILRFNEDALSTQTDAVQKVIYDNIVEASQEHKKGNKKGSEEEMIMIKQASFIDCIESDNTICEKHVLPGNIGYIWLLGDKKND